MRIEELFCSTVRHGIKSFADFPLNKVNCVIFWTTCDKLLCLCLLCIVDLVKAHLIIVNLLQIQLTDSEGLKKCILLSVKLLTAENSGEIERGSKICILRLVTYMLERALVYGNVLLSFWCDIMITTSIKITVPSGNDLPVASIAHAHTICLSPSPHTDLWCFKY